MDEIPKDYDLLSPYKAQQKFENYSDKALFELYVFGVFDQNEDSASLIKELEKRKIIERAKSIYDKCYDYFKNLIKED